MLLDGTDSSLLTELRGTLRFSESEDVAVSIEDFFVCWLCCVRLQSADKQLGGFGHCEQGLL